MHPFVFKPVALPEGTEALRQQIRRFLQAEVDAGAFVGTSGLASAALSAVNFSTVAPAVLSVDSMPPTVP